jgi:hypothetical protein
MYKDNSLVNLLVTARSPESTHKGPDLGSGKGQIANAGYIG